MVEGTRDTCGVCERNLEKLEVGICGVCKRKGPPSWSECRGPIEFHYRTMRYRDATELTTHAQKQAAVDALERELSRSIRALKMVRKARYRLPANIDDLTASWLSSLLYALPHESWKRVTHDIKKATANDESTTASRHQIP